MTTQEQYGLLFIVKYFKSVGVQTMTSLGYSSKLGQHEIKPPSGRNGRQRYTSIGNSDLMYILCSSYHEGSEEV